MTFAQVYNEITGESQANPTISITLAELGQLQNSSGQTIPLNQYYTPRPDGNLPTVFPTEWYLYCQRCNVPAPYITISKTAPTSVNSGVEFAYRLTIANNGQVNSSGDIIVRDYIPNGLSFVRYERDTPAWGFSISGQQVTATFTSSLPVGFGAVITIYVTTNTQGTYSNFASVEGGGETITKTSNTVYTGVGGVPTWTSSVTKRLVRTIQKNNCDAYGIGSFQEVYSPFFTATYTSTISQPDADTNANNNATALCNQWLDENGQAVANSSGTCQYDYPQMTLSKTMPGAFNLNQSGEVEIIMRTLGAATSGQIVMYDDLASGFEYVSLISKPDIFDLNIYGRSVTFTTNASLQAGYFGQFKFLVRAITVGNYTNFAAAYGGSILNNNATSNTISTYVFSTPIFSFTRVIDNQSYYNGTSINANAAPTDLIYNGTILTINSFPSTNDSKVRIEFELPIPFRVVDDVQVNYNTDYFTFSQGSAFNIAVFTQKDNVTVPVGQYGFYIFFSLPITYFRMSTVSQDEDLRDDDNLVIDALNITVPRKATTLVKNYVNNNFINSGGITTIWSNNYTFLPIFQTTNNRIPNDVNGLTYSFSVNNKANYSPQYSMGFINQQFFATQVIYVVNPPRDTKNGVVNADYPYQYVIDNLFSPDEYQFGIRIYYRIYKNGLLIKSDLNTQNTFFETKIDKAKNEPKYRNTTFSILVDANNNYLYW
ncbi:DUF5977 domain-containing protein [Brevundimonas sp.]|uniref:DUF5977 domain-containing protein n=1 Tax=Brevundimonas sp. TaxID=1871086 RepID=UPI0037833FCC